MSTRALYTFKGETSAKSWNVYKHHNGYPTGAADTLKTALDFFAWQLPRYESDEFAAAFIAAGKCVWLEGSEFNEPRFRENSPGGKYRSYCGGGVRMMPQGEPQTVAQKHCSDIEYRYEIALGNDGNLRVKAYTVNTWENYSENLIIDCPIAKFPAEAKAWEKKANAA